MFSLLLVIIYLAFISLGLPDSLLGAAWPSMYQEFSVPVSYAGGISMIIAAGTIISSLKSDRQTRRFGAGKVVAFSVLLTAMALFGFSISSSYLELCLWAVPYGLGAGGVDAALNNYVALHYASRHMSWLHCMWGVGASAGPYIMGFALTGGQSWNMGYRYIGILQTVLAGILFFSLPLWNKREKGGVGKTDAGEPGNTGNLPAETGSPLSLTAVIQIPGAKEVMLTFFCYCAFEQTAGLWASSYLVLRHGLSAETAAWFASLFYLGITAGRALSGFLTLKFNDNQMIRLGIGGIVLGLLALFLPLLLPIGSQFAFESQFSFVGFILMGLGCAPIYPSVIHAVPERFGPEKSQAIIGVQMASAYVGTCIMPALFGWIANHVSVSLLPVYLLALAAVMGGMQMRMERRIAAPE